MQPVFRFAPSPNGELHLGHAWSALLNQALAREAGGRLLLRIEDIDGTRSRKDFEDGIYRDLAWLGIAWETPVRRQSEHMDAYGEAVAKLAAMDLIYPAFTSRAGTSALTAAPDWPRDPDGAPLHPPHDRAIDPLTAMRRVRAGEPHALRLKVDAAMAMTGPLTWQEAGEGPAGETGTVRANAAMWGDFIVARKETPTSYHLSVVVDDALQGVTHVVRGRDLFHATAAHVLLQRLLGLPSPAYHHHRLVTDAAGRKLAKSDRDTSLRALREGGATPADVKRMVGLAE